MLEVVGMETTREAHNPISGLTPNSEKIAEMVSVTTLEMEVDASTRATLQSHNGEQQKTYSVFVKSVLH